MRAGTDFETAVRRGRRAGGPRIVVHCARADSGGVQRAGEDSDGAPRVGFVVSRAVGGSVVRHRVARRLRAVVRPHVPVLPPGTLIVVRALPAAAAATSAVLASDVARLFERLALTTPGLPG
jgi:ribonuclease P protein component